MGDTHNFVNQATRRARILHAIESFLSRFGYPPSYRDIAAETGDAHSVVHYNVTKLIAEGLVEQTPGKHRSLRAARKAA